MSDAPDRRAPSSSSPLTVRWWWRASALVLRSPPGSLRPSPPRAVRRCRRWPATRSEVALPRWGITEPVNEVVYGTRGFDTFGETFLFWLQFSASSADQAPRAAAEASSARSRRRAASKLKTTPPRGVAAERPGRPRGQRGPHRPRHGPPTPDFEPLGTPAPESRQGMSVVVRIAARVVSPVLAVVGVYLVAWGYSPGGGFPAGAVVAGVILLAYASFRIPPDRPRRPASLFETLELLGALAIIACEPRARSQRILLGQLAAARRPQTIPSGGILQLFSGSELIEVGTGLAARHLRHPRGHAGHTTETRRRGADRP